MECKIMFLLICQIFIHFIALTTNAQPEVHGHLCSENDNYSANSTYQTNLNHLLNSMYTNTKIDYGFYNSSYGENLDKVYAIALCRPDVRPDGCRNCMNYSSMALTSLCPNHKEAIIALENCSLRYTHRSIFGVMEVTPNFTLYNLNYVSDAIGFNKSLHILLDRQRDEASKGNSSMKYAAGEIGAPDSQTIYAISQCTPDLSEKECSSCLSNASGLISQCCEARQGATVFLPSCNFRYEINKYYDPIIELPSSDPPKAGKQSVIIIATVSAVIFLILILCISILLRLKKPKDFESEKAMDDSIEVGNLHFDFETIKFATDDFSEANKLGKGGFGAVYKGTLSNGQDIAVKRLSKSSTQGELEFKNEILLVAKLQHKNLVKLLGFCFHQEERLLVYEFLPNSSLDSFIFNPTKRLQLDWEKRYKIISGIGRGLLYLHQDSCFRIIHRDLKPSNILLDAEWNPKISDFGTARLFGADQSQSSTQKIAGTLGYMPPEYVKHGKFSIRSDVFSFGVLVLETVSGRKRSFGDGEEVYDLLTYAWENWNQGTALNLVDPILRTVGSTHEMMRCIHIALLCVQEKMADRPTMASVVIMLSSYSLTLPIPLKPAFFIHSTVLPEASSSSMESNQPHISSKNEVSASELYPR